MYYFSRTQHKHFTKVGDQHNVTCIIRSFLMTATKKVKRTGSLTIYKMCTYEKIPSVGLDYEKCTHNEYK